MKACSKTIENTGLGKLKDYKMKLHIDESVTPVAQMMKKASDKLEELENDDIIEKVDGPSSQVSPIFTVPKNVGKDVRLVVDMRQASQANQAIIRERHPIPAVDDILYKMNGGKVFSKLDLNQAFHQIELDEE